MITQPPTYLKAIVACLLAGLSAFAAGLPWPLTAAEWVTVALAVVVAFGSVYGISNRPAAEHRATAREDVKAQFTGPSNMRRVDPTSGSWTTGGYSRRDEVLPPPE